MITYGGLHEFLDSCLHCRSALQEVPPLRDHVDGHQNHAQDFAGNVAVVVQHVDQPHLDRGELSVELVGALDEEEVLALKNVIYARF